METRGIERSEMLAQSEGIHHTIREGMHHTIREVSMEFNKVHFPTVEPIVQENELRTGSLTHEIRLCFFNGLFS